MGLSRSASLSLLMILWISILSNSSSDPKSSDPEFTPVEDVEIGPVGGVIDAGVIDLVALQHLEGGPEAQIYIHVRDYKLELCGSYESGFFESEDNHHAWSIPFVIGVNRLEALRN